MVKRTSDNAYKRLTISNRYLVFPNIIFNRRTNEYSVFTVVFGAEFRFVDAADSVRISLKHSQRQIQHRISCAISRSSFSSGIIYKGDTLNIASEQNFFSLLPSGRIVLSPRLVLVKHSYQIYTLHPLYVNLIRITFTV